MTVGDPKVNKVLTHFQALSSVASSLNAASDELAKGVDILDEALRKLNIGLTVWVPFRFRVEDDSTGAYDQDEIGYAKVQSNWGLALRRIYGEEASDTHYEIGPSLFKDTPRELRLLAVDKIPEVFEALAKEAFNTTKRIQEKTKEVRELAGAIASVTTEAKAKAKSVTLAERIVSSQKSPTQPLADIGKAVAAAAFFGELPGRDTKAGGK
jgi:prefoldin subunit 5